MIKGLGELHGFVYSYGRWNIIDKKHFVDAHSHNGKGNLCHSVKPPADCVRLYCLIDKIPFF